MTEQPVCWACVVSLHEECPDPQPLSDELAELGYITCCCVLRPDDSTEGHSIKSERKGEVGRPAVDVELVADAVSTGRRRSQMLYPIMPGQVCEWAGLRHAGGGAAPIIGCTGNLIIERKGGDPDRGYVQGDRHHGPDKNTFANEPGNVHRICVFCHHRWHALNDKHYGKRPRREDGKVDATKPFLPKPDVESFRHDPDTKATTRELEESEEYWARNRRKADEAPVDEEETPDEGAEIPAEILDYDPLS